MTFAHNPVAVDSYFLLLTAVLVVFGIAGWIKGVVGMGLPTFAMGVLGLLMTPAAAAVWLLAPSLVTNVWQFAAGPTPTRLLRRLAIFLMMIGVGTFVGVPLMLANQVSPWPGVMLGGVLVAYAILALLLPKLRVPSQHEIWMSPLVGFATGVLTGATGVFVVPAVPYLSAIDLTKDELVAALGLSFTVSTIALGLALTQGAAITPAQVLQSSLAIAPALLGMWLGQRMRARFDATTFRRGFFCALLVLGCTMLFRGIVAGL
jgi:uncharacterized protein